MDEISLKISLGALIEVPKFEYHTRGKNWLAIISLDPDSPGGLARKFIKRARGESYYYFVDQLKVGDPIEFGADYYTTGNNKRSDRAYYVVLEKTDEFLRIKKFDTAKQAVKINL